MIINPRCEIQNTKFFDKKNYDKKQKAHIMLNEQCKCNVHKQKISIFQLTLEYMYKLVHTHIKSKIP